MNYSLLFIIFELRRFGIFLPLKISKCFCAHYIGYRNIAYREKLCLNIRRGRKFGRKKTIITGLALFIGAFAAYLIVDGITGKALTLVYVALVLGGFANMLITVNTLPLVLEIGGLDKVGTFTGYYYTATFSAQIATPIIYGIVRMLTGTYASLFYYCPICFILSILCIFAVKHGESEEITEEIIEEARLADD